VVLVTNLLLPAPADQIGVQEEINKGGLQLFPVDVMYYMKNQLVIDMVGVVDGSSNSVALGDELTIGKLIHPIHQLGQVFFWIFGNVINGLLNAEFFQTIGNLHQYPLLFFTTPSLWFKKFPFSIDIFSNLSRKPSLSAFCLNEREQLTISIGLDTIKTQRSILIHYKYKRQKNTIRAWMRSCNAKYYMQRNWGLWHRIRDKWMQLLPGTRTLPSGTPMCAARRNWSTIPA